MSECDCTRNDESSLDWNTLLCSTWKVFSQDLLLHTIFYVFLHSPEFNIRNNNVIKHVAMLYCFIFLVLCLFLTTRPLYKILVYSWEMNNQFIMPSFWCCYPFLLLLLYINFSYYSYKYIFFYFILFLSHGSSF